MEQKWDAISDQLILGALLRIMLPRVQQNQPDPPTIYNPKDLGRFADMGKFAAPLMEKFFDYYLAATSSEGALTRREKSLIGLAVAHSKQCPYCIEAYTGQCAETGAPP